MKSWFKKQIAVLLTLVLAFSVTVPVSAEGTDDSVQKVTVTLSGQYDNEFFFAPGEYEIPSDEAEKYGYEDEQGGVTALDALVYAHELAYGKDFTTETKDQYLTVSDGSVEKAFRKNDLFVFLVNERCPHTEEEDFMGYERKSIGQSMLKSGDLVNFYFELTFSDRCAWFEKDGKKVTNLVVEENSTLNLVLKGYTCYLYGTSTEETITEYTSGIENAQIALLKIGEIESEPIENAITDIGKVTVSGLKAGEYYLSAYYPKTEGMPLTESMVMPLCKLRVVKYQDVLTNALANRKAGIDNVSYGDEWAVLAQARNGNTDDAWYHSYYRSVEQTLAASRDNVIGEGTANARTAIAVTAMGLDATNVGGKNLLEPLADFSVAIGSYVTNAIYALIAFDCGDYDIPETSAEDKTTREKLIDYILSNFNENGYIGYTWDGVNYDDLDSMAMAIQALAPYYKNNEKVKETVDKALNYLSEHQNVDGTFGSGDAVCTTAQVICALSALGIDAQKDERFIKNNMSGIEGILPYVKDDGSIAVENSYDPIMSTEQAGYALVAYNRLKNNKNGLYEIAKDNVAADAFYKCADAKKVTKNKKDATCTEVGYTGDECCDICGLVCEKGVDIPKKEHTIVIDPAVEATEDKEGKTEGSHCSVCNTVIKAQTVVPKKEKKTEQTTTAITTTEAPTTQQEVVLDKPSGDKVKSTKKKQIKITLKARKNITGYQIQVSTSSKFKKAKVYKVKNTVSSKTIKGLKSKKTYYVRIRTYNQFVENNQKVTIYSKWSKVNKLKVK